MKAKEEFIEYIINLNKIKGLDDLSSKLVAILYVEPKEISLEELAKRTGYSLSAVSTYMKSIERMGIIKRTKKPKSKKIYFYMEKDTISKFKDLWKKRYSKLIETAKHKVPEIIEKYKKEKGSEEELRIIKNHYKQILSMEKIMKKFIQMLEDETNN